MSSQSMTQLRGNSIRESVKLAMSAVAIVLFGTLTANASLQTPIYDPYSNSDLYIVGSTSSSWTQAQAQAQAMGGNLVTIHSAAENAFVANVVFRNLTSSGGPNLSQAYAISIGYYDPTGAANADGHGAQHAADFVWVDGESTTYTNWNTGEPNDGYYQGYQYPYEDWTVMYGPDATPVNEAAGGAAVATGSWDDAPVIYPIPVLGTTGLYGIAEVAVPEPVTISLFVYVAVLAIRPRRTGST